MSKKTTSPHHTVPAALITHCTAIIRGRQDADIAAYHARTTDARLSITWGGVLVTIYNAAAAHGILEGFLAAHAAAAQLPREIPPPAASYEAPFARPTVAMEWTSRPAYAVVAQSGPAKTNDRVIHWIDLHMGPITWQIRDLVGLRSATDLLHRAYITAVAVFLDGTDYADDPTADDHQLPA
ncbi:hypothetical protein [Mycobacterium sp.]|uniref:hypothetical protein n=1 Tax=Mycobacterium sp. TaxID=1785 RepID=UPI002BCB5A33|nr:hypothetical protein [Mycobacterium sp.]HME49168.1 hypothetical protein [Mycobacterium sp.]